MSIFAKFSRIFLWNLYLPRIVMMVGRIEFLNLRWSTQNYLFIVVVELNRVCGRRHLLGNFLKFTMTEWFYCVWFCYRAKILVTYRVATRKLYLFYFFKQIIVLRHHSNQSEWRAREKVKKVRSTSKLVGNMLGIGLGRQCDNPIVQ